MWNNGDMGFYSVFTAHLTDGKITERLLNSVHGVVMQLWLSINEVGINLNLTATTLFPACLSWKVDCHLENGSFSVLPV